MFFQARVPVAVRNLLGGPHDGAQLEGSRHGPSSPTAEGSGKRRLATSAEDPPKSPKPQTGSDSTPTPWRRFQTWVRLKMRHHRISFYEPSTHQKAWAPRPAHVSFSGTLWVDLTMVGVLYRLDEFFLAGGYSGDHNGLWVPFFLLLALYDAWEVRPWLQAEFRTKGISFVHSVLSLVSWLIVALLGASIPYQAYSSTTQQDVPGWGSYDQNVFAYLKMAHGILRVISYLEVWKFSKSKRARTAALPRLITYSCGTAVLVLAPILLAQGVRIKWVSFCYFGSFLVQKYTWHCIFVWDFRGMRTKADSRAAVNLPFIIARLRDWNQLQLGASILGLVTSTDLSEGGELAARYVVAVTGFLFVAFLDMLTYASEPVVYADHALLVGGLRAVFWYDLFVLLTMSFMGIAVGLRYIFQTPARADKINIDFVTMLGVCSASAIIFIVLQEIQHKSKEVINTRRRVWGLKGLLACSCLIAPLLIVNTTLPDESLYWITLNLCLSTLATLAVHAINGGFRREVAKKTKIRLRGHLLAVLIARKWLMLYRERQAERCIDLESGRVNPKLKIQEEYKNTLVEEETLLDEEEGVPHAPLGKKPSQRFVFSDEDEDEDEDDAQTTIQALRGNPPPLSAGASDAYKSGTALVPSQRRRSLDESARERTARLSLAQSSVSDLDDEDPGESARMRLFLPNSLASSLAKQQDITAAHSMLQPVSQPVSAYSEPPQFLANALANNLGSVRKRAILFESDTGRNAKHCDTEALTDRDAILVDPAIEEPSKAEGTELQEPPPPLPAFGSSRRSASEPNALATFVTSRFPGNSQRKRTGLQGARADGSESVGGSKRSRPWELLMSSRRRRRLKKDEFDATANNAVAIRVLTKVLNDHFFELPHLLVEQDIFAEYTLSWSDLFLDITFIGVVYRLGSFLLSGLGLVPGESDPSRLSNASSVFVFVCLFYAIFNLWWSKLQFACKCGVSDVFHKFLDVGQGLIVVICALNITSPQAMADSYSGSTMTVSGLIGGFHLSLLFLWIEVLFSRPKDATTKACALRNIRREFLALFAIFLALLACGLNAPLEVIAALWALSWLLPSAERFLTIAMIKPGEKAPFLLRYVLHRVGDGNLILLGEGVLQVIRAVSRAYNSDVFLVFSISFLIMSAVRIALFEMDCFDAHARKHVVLRSRRGHLLVMMIRCLASPAVVCIGVGLKVIVSRTGEPPSGLEGPASCLLDVPGYELLCIGSALTLSSFQLIYHLHRTWFFRQLRWKHLMFAIFLAVSFLVLPWIPCIGRVTVVACTLSIWVVAIAFHSMTDDLFSFNDAHLTEAHAPRLDGGAGQAPSTGDGAVPTDPQARSKKEVVEESHRLLWRLKDKGGSQANAQFIMRSSRYLVSDLRHRASSVSSVTRTFMEGVSPALAPGRSPFSSARSRVTVPPMVLAANESARSRSITDAMIASSEPASRSRSPTDALSSHSIADGSTADDCISTQRLESTTLANI